MSLLEDFLEVFQKRFFLFIVISFIGNGIGRIVFICISCQEVEKYRVGILQLIAKNKGGDIFWDINNSVNWVFSY